jgi:hypothetical protein
MDIFQQIKSGEDSTTKLSCHAKCSPENTTSYWIYVNSKKSTSVFWSHIRIALHMCEELLPQDWLNSLFCWTRDPKNGMTILWHTISSNSFGSKTDNEVDAKLWKTVSARYASLGHAIDQAVSCWLPATAARVRCQVRSCGICGGQSGTGAGFLQVFQFPLPIFIPTAPHSSSSITCGWYNRPNRGSNYQVDSVSSHPKKKKLASLVTMSARKKKPYLMQHLPT